MSEAFGLGDGPNDLSTVGAEADAKVADARRAQPHSRDAGRWVGGTTVLRLLLALVLLIVVLGWVVTAFNGGA